MRAPRLTMPTLAGIRRVSVVSLAALVTSAIVLTGAPSPAMAENLDEAANLSLVTEVETPAFALTNDRLPVIESLLGRGAALGTDPAGRIDLRGTAGNASGALVRVTLLDPAQATTVFTGENATPVLRGGAGETASTTVLLGVTDGAVSLWADQPAAIRVETLAALSGSDLAPGSTIALPTPVTRADTAGGLSGAQLSDTDLWFGLTGQGGVPSEQVRSTYVTLSVTLPEPGTLLLGATQRLALPAGTSTVTTVVTPDDHGGVTTRLQGGATTGALRADVLGWVAEADADASRANSTGSFVPALEEKTPQDLAVSPNPQHLELADAEDVATVLALVSSTPTAATETSTLVWGDAASGRATGVAVDSTSGTLPQLTLVPVTERDSTLAIRRGAASVSVQPLGGFLGKVAVPQAGEDDTTIRITSPSDDATIDISDAASFELTGTVDAGDHSLDRVEISSPSVGFIGTAEINYDDSITTWSLRVTAPEDGDYEYVATAFDRADPASSAASASIRVHLDVPEPTDTVTNPEAVVLDDDDSDDVDPPVEVRSTTQLAFRVWPGLAPGDLIVVDSREGSPDGFLGRVVAINFVADEWIVDTEVAPLEDLILQADINETTTYGDGSGIEIDEVAEDSVDPEDPDSPISSGTYVDESGATQQIDDFTVDTPAAPGEHTQLVTGSDVDLEPFSNERTPGDGGEPTGDQIAEDGTWPFAPPPSEQEIGPPPGSDTVDSGLLTDSGLGAGMHQEWTLKLGAKFLVSFEGDKPKVQNFTGAAAGAWGTAQTNSLETKRAMALEINGEIGLALDIVLSASVKYKWKVIPKGVTINEFTVRLTTKLKAEASLKASFEVKRSFGLNQKLAHADLPSIRFVVGVVPVVITNGLNIKAGIDFAGTAAVTLPLIGVERTDTFGFTYSSSGGMKRLKDDPKTTYPPLKFTHIGQSINLSLAASATVGPEIGFESLIYGFAGPEFTLYAHVGLTGTIQTDLREGAPYEAEIEFFLAYGLQGEAKLKLLAWNLLNLSVFNLGWKLSIWNRKWEFTL